MLKMFLILTYFWNLILLLPRLLGAFLSDTSTLVCFLMVSPEKHDGPLPPIPEHHPEQGFPTSRQADQGPWAGTRTEGDCGCVCSMGSHPVEVHLQDGKHKGSLTWTPCSKSVEPYTGKGMLQFQSLDNDLLHHEEGLTFQVGLDGQMGVTITQTDYENPFHFSRPAPHVW